MPYGPDKINEIVDAFNSLAPGEDIIHGNDIIIKELQGTQRAFEYGKYTDDILAKIHMALKVPMTMWSDPEKARPIFEPYVRYLQTLVESCPISHRENRGTYVITAVCLSVCLFMCL